MECKGYCTLDDVNDDYLVAKFRPYVIQRIGMGCCQPRGSKVSAEGSHVRCIAVASGGDVKLRSDAKLQPNFQAQGCKGFRSPNQIACERCLIAANDGANDGYLIKSAAALAFLQDCKILLTHYSGRQKSRDDYINYMRNIAGYSKCDSIRLPSSLPPASPSAPAHT